MYNEQLDTFISVAESGSFSKTAEQMYISRNAVMQQINLLEKNTDLTLFIRTTHGVKLTAAGKIFLQQTKKLRALCNEINHNMQKYKNTIHIGTGFLNQPNLIPLHWRDFQKESPNAKIDFIDISNYEKIPDQIQIIEGSFSNKPFVRQRFSFHKLMTIPYLIAIPNSSSLINKKKITLSDLKDQTILLPDNSIYKFNSNFIQKLNDSARIKIEYYTQFDTALISQVQLQNKYILIPQSLKSLFPEQSVKPVSFSIKADYGIYYRDTDNQIAQNFLEYLITKYLNKN